MIAPSTRSLTALSSWLPLQKGLDQLDRGEGIPQDEIKKQLASWLTN
jgi:hypothetical protein